MILNLLTCLALTLPAMPQERPTAEGLIEQAWTLLPPYGGAHRFLLSELVERDTQAGRHLLEAGLALQPTHIRGLWSLGHARVLLAENHRNRGRAVQARTDYRAAIKALGRAIELDGQDAWSPYARAMAHSAAGFQGLALGDLELALGNAERAIAAGQDQSQMRFKSLEWMPEVQMRLGLHALARKSLRSFHGEFSSNTWPLLIALGESYQRERDFAGARAVYQQAIEEFPNDFQAYALMGYLEGLTSHPESAVKHMRLAIRNERFAGMYTRLWLWILTPPAHGQAALKDLTAFLKNPPDSVSSWDRSLGQFAIGQVGHAAFRTTLEAEIQRRLDDAEALDELRCEADYYQGQRYEREAGKAAHTDQVTDLLQQARSAYSRALSARPVKWKWEWAYARLGFARVSELLQSPSPGPPAILPGASQRWHRPGTDQPQAFSQDLGQAGDLLLSVPPATASPRAVQRVVLGAE